MWQTKTPLALQSEQAAAHFGALLKMVRHRQGVRQLEVLAHLPGWTQATYSRVETGEVSPAFAQLAQIYRALQLAGVELSAADRQQFLTLARLRIEAKKTYQEHLSDAQWDDLRLRLSRSEPQDAGVNGHPLPGQRPITTNPRLVETRHLVGREDWLVSVAASLQEGVPKKLLVLQGPMGIGKSSELHRLALHMLSLEPSRFQVSLCELPAAGREIDPESALDLLLGTLLAEMGSPDASLHLPSLDLRITYALHTLEKASRPVLLFVDNGERFLTEEGRFALCWERFVQRFLRSQHRSTLILATREWPGWFEGERAFVIERIVPPLSSEAGALLLQQLGLADVPVAYLQQASEVVGGVPLCLEWVASLVQEPMWLDEWQENDDLDEPEEGETGHVSTRRLLRLLDDASLFGGPIATKLHPLLERIIEKRLSPEAYQVLCTLSLAHLPLSKPALPLLCPRPRLLKELSANSLLVAYPHRVQVLPMVASAIQARLSADQQDQIEERLIEVYRFWLDDGKASIRDMGMIIAEMATLYLKHHRLLNAAELLIRYGWLSFNLGLAPRLTRFAQNLMQQFDWQATGDHECGGMLLHYHLSPFLGQTIDTEKRFADFQHLQERALNGKLHLQPPTGVYITHHMMVYAINKRQFETAKILLEDCCAHLEPVQGADLDLQASLLEKRAMLLGAWSEEAEAQGKIEQTKALREQSVELYEQCIKLLSSDEKASPFTTIRMKKRLGLCLNRLSDELNRLGKHEEALSYVERGIELKEQGFVEVGALAASYGEKAEILMELGRFQEALCFDEKALVEVQRFADAGHSLSQEEVWIYRVNRGRLYLRLGRIGEAEPLLQKALPHIHPRRKLYQMFAEDALEEIRQWRQTATSSYQLDWRWAERYRELDAFDAYWWWAQAGPFSEEEQRQWEKLYRPAPDEGTKEALGSLIAQSRRRELVAALSEQREPRLWYPALEIAEVRRRITGMLHLEEDINRQEPNALVRRLYQGAIEEEVCFLRLIEATYDGDSECFVQLDQRLNPAPTLQEMEEALAGLRLILAQGLLDPETAEVSQRIMQYLHQRLHLSLDLSMSEAEAQARQHDSPINPSQSGQMVSAPAARRFFEAILCENGYEGWQVSLDLKASGPRVESGLRQLFLPEHSLSVERIREYLAHELAGHVERAVMGERSLLGLLGIGTRGHLLTEEGLALYRERQALVSSGQPFDDSGIWFGVLATGFASGVITPPQTFLSLHAFFEPLHLLFRLLKHLDKDMDVAQERARNAAFARCLRTYRGVPDLSRQGVCFSKDVVYLRGLRQIEHAVAQDESVLSHLAVGKIALDDIPLMQELGIQGPSQSLQDLAYQPGLDGYILSFEQIEKPGSKLA